MKVILMFLVVVVSLGYILIDSEHSKWQQVLNSAPAQGGEDITSFPTKFGVDIPDLGKLTTTVDKVREYDMLYNYKNHLPHIKYKQEMSSKFLDKCEAIGASVVYVQYKNAYGDYARNSCSHTTINTFWYLVSYGEKSQYVHFKFIDKHNEYKGDMRDVALLANDVVKDSFNNEYTAADFMQNGLTLVEHGYLKSCLPSKRLPDGVFYYLSVKRDVSKWTTYRWTLTFADKYDCTSENTDVGFP